MERLEDIATSFADPETLSSSLDGSSALNIDSIAGNLRQQLRSSIVAKQTLAKLGDQLELQPVVKSIVSEILSSSSCNKLVLAKKLERGFALFSSVYEAANITQAHRKKRYVCNTGLVISPDDCRNSIKDTLRVHAFIRGIDQAISQQFTLGKKSLNIIYPACGPFAPLLLPLIAHYHQQSLYASQQLRISLVDIQEGACASLEALVEALGIHGYIDGVHCCNAQDFAPKHAADVIILEAIQHGFSREGHLLLAKHFADMLTEDGVFLPQEIHIGAALNVGQREFVDQWLPNSENTAEHDLRNERTELGQILKVDLAFLREMRTEVQDEHTQLLKCGAVCIPQLKRNHDKQLLLIHSKVKVFSENYVNEYESGITHPLPDLQVCINFTPNDPRAGDLLVKSGDTLRFYYCMNGLPGFLPIKEVDALAQEYLASE